MTKTILLVPLLLLASRAFPQAPPFDVIVEEGRIFDGTGNSWYVGDIGVRGDTIAAIGVLAGAPARLRIDARGLAVAPGFIDIHSHARQGLFQSPLAENCIRQGVTTVIEGNDGGSPLPLRAFLDKLASHPVTVNLGTFVGQGSIRQAVIGSRNRKAEPEEIRKMKDLARQAMEDGAFGLSTGLFYVPGNFTPTEEIIEIARVVGRLGGMHISHMREESGQVIESVRETIRIGEEGGLPTQVTHHKIMGPENWGKSAATIRLVEEARARGVDVTIDQYPYTASSTGLAAVFPRWALESGNEALKERLAAPETRARIKADIVGNLKGYRAGGDPRNIQLAVCSFDPNLAGKNLAEVTAARGLAATLENAAETAMELARKGNCSAVYHVIGEDDVERIMRYPFTMIASDGGVPLFGENVPHPRNYGAFARVLGRYVRERKVLPLEDAVRRMSSLPAGRLKIFDRGLIRTGMKADMLVFDPGVVSDKSVFERPHQYAVGVRHVLVNGKPVLLNGEITGEKPGRLLYGPAARRN